MEVFAFLVFCVGVSVEAKNENASWKKTLGKRVQNKLFRSFFGKSWGGVLSGGHERVCEHALSSA